MTVYFEPDLDFVFRDFSLVSVFGKRSMQYTYARESEDGAFMMIENEYY